MLLQANRFENFTDNGDAYALASGRLSRTTISQGLGDLLLMGRYMFFHVSEQHFSVIGGLKLPTGDVRQRTNQGDLVGTHNQPGSGSVDFQLGVAYAGEFGKYLFVTADALVRVNTEGAGSFRSGNSIQADLAVGTRLWVLFPSVELNGFFQQQDIENNEIKKNSGVYSVFVTPALRASFGHHSLFAAVSLPMVQAFERSVISNVEQFRVSAGYAVSFGGEEGHEAHPPPPAPPAGGAI